jgi:hypothetical protein
VETHAKRQFLYIPTLIAIAIVACTAFILPHLVAEHAGVAVLLGEQVRGISSTTWNMADTWEGVIQRIGVWGFRAIVAGGPAVSFTTGAVALLLLRSEWVARSSMRYFLWFFATISFIEQTPHNLVAGVSVPGSDGWLLMRELEPSIPWIIGVMLAGLLFTWIGYHFPLCLWMPSTTDGRHVLGAVTTIPVLMAFIIQLLSVLASRLLELPTEGFQPLVATVSSFIPLLLWLVLVNATPWPRASASLETLRLRQSIGWLVAGLVASFQLVAVIGPGLGSFEGYSSTA